MAFGARGGALSLGRIAAGSSCRDALDKAKRGAKSAAFRRLKGKEQSRNMAVLLA
jgi:hypothetical protein